MLVAWVKSVMRKMGDAGGKGRIDSVMQEGDFLQRCQGGS
jgi:hypothetical protein